MFNECVFSYFITDNSTAKDLSFSELPVKRSFGDYTVFTDTDTPFSYCCNGETECAIFGLAVNVVSGESNGLTDDIVKNCKSIQNAVEYEINLGGKYILLFKHGGDYYVQGDASCSIPVFYNTEDAFVCSSNFQYIVNLKKYHADNEYVKIRNSGDIFQAMPYDITPYRQIKQLIPNHYLSVNKRASVRFANFLEKQKEISVDEATQIVHPMIEKLTSFYLKKYKIYCPITSGKDSRVVLSFLLNSKEKFCCYTIRHPEHNDMTQDITVPIELCKKIGIEHKLVEDIVVSESVKNRADNLLGVNNYSSRTLRIAQTIKEYFGDGAIINGDIIGQVGKCSLHRDIPDAFATASYFRCKLHNYSIEAKQQLKLWLDEIKSSGEKINVFDLFSIENRMGRWAAQINLLYNSIGQISLNVFNSRSIVYTLTAVSRTERKKAYVHISLINKTEPKLLMVPFEKDLSAFVRVSKINGITYLLASYLKYFAEKILFLYKKKGVIREEGTNSK